MVDPRGELADPPPPPADYDPLAEETVGPMVRVMGARLVAWSNDYARVEMPVGPTVINRQGVIHGGALAALLDTAAGYSGAWCPYPGRYRRAFTLTLTTQYIAATDQGLVIAEGRRTGGGMSVFFSEATARSADGQLLATATGVFKYRGQSGRLYGEPRPEG